MPNPAAFPESRFAPTTRGIKPYRALVSRGRRVMQEKRVVICGLARNIARILPRTIARVEHLGAMFADYRVVIYENDSHDATREILFGWQRANGRVSVLSERRGDPVNRPVRSLGRAERMACYRNQYREFAASRFGDFDHVIVVDTDLAAGWSYEGVANTFGQEGWDFVGSYGLIQRTFWTQTLLVQFDAWAFRPLGSYRPLPTKVVNHMHWRRGDPLVPVFSCFGGLGVYRMEAMRACAYEGADCEHVCLHRNMQRAGLDRLYLNPSQITFYGRKANNLVRACRHLAHGIRRRAA